jgi:hypothetical protein
MVLSLAVDSAAVIYAGMNSAGAKVSHDHGTTWTTLNSGVDRENKFGYGIFQSTIRSATISNHWIYA